MIKKNSRTLVILLLITLQGIFLFSSCTHLILPTEQNEGILVTGSATVQAAPDLATLQVGVQSFAETAQQATADNNLEVEKIIASLKNKGLTDEDMETNSFNISPQREYKNNKPPVVIGFNVTNMLAIKIRDLDRVGELMQATIDNGANTINGLTFSIEDPTPLRQKARRIAMEAALSRAEILAEAIDVGVGKPISIQELSYGGPVVQSEDIAIAGVAMDAKVPIQAPSDVGTKIDLQVRFEIK